MSSSHRYTDERNFAVEAEEHMIDPKGWLQAPEEVRRKAEELLSQGSPLGIANHPTEGWLILMMLNGPGDRPTVAWRQPEPEPEKKRGRRIFR